jgi:hypothetical protein
MDRVTIEDIDDREPSQHEDPEVNLAEMPTEDGVRYLMSHGTAEMDARFLVAMAKGEVGGDARPVRSGSDVRTS